VPRTSSTPERVLWAIEQLDLGPSDHVLEIGCGGGHAVTLLCERLRRGRVVAIDRSALQVERARARNAPWIAAGRARIEQVVLEEAPAILGAGRFARILAINVNAFWTAPGPNVSALVELLAPDGRAFLVYEPPSPARLREARRRLPELVATGALEVADVRTVAFRRSHGLCIVGQRAPNG
jgi:protein-L-isoaspartate O-methyltransferase